MMSTWKRIVKAWDEDLFWDWLMLAYIDLALLSMAVRSMANDAAHSYWGWVAFTLVVYCVIIYSVSTTWYKKVIKAKRTK